MRATQLVDHQGGQRFTINVFRDDEQRTAGLGYLFQNREKVLHAADFLFIDEDERVIQGGFHALGVGHEVRREVTTVKLHAFHNFQAGFHGAGLFHGDHAVFADFLHGFGNDAANGFVVVGGNGANLGNHVAADGLGQAVQEALAALAIFAHDAANGVNRALNAALQGHRIRAGGNRLHAVTIDGLGQNRGSGGAVTGNVTGLAGDFTHHLRAHVFQGLAQFNFLGYRHAVLGDDRGAEFLVDDDVAAVGTERDLSLHRPECSLRAGSPGGTLHRAQ